MTNKLTNTGLTMRAFLRHGIDYLEFNQEMPMRRRKQYPRQNGLAPSPVMGDGVPDEYAGTSYGGEPLKTMLTGATNPTVIEFPDDHFPERNQVRVSPKTKQAPAHSPNFSGEDLESLSTGLEPHFLPHGSLAKSSCWRKFAQVFEFTDRYEALGIPYPNRGTMCRGDCEGIGFVPVNFAVATDADMVTVLHSDEDIEKYFKLWEAAEMAEPSDDGWQFVECLDCGGTGKRIAQVQERLPEKMVYWIGIGGPISEMSFDENNNELLVTFRKGKKYKHFKVPDGVASLLKSSPDRLGSMYAKFVRGKYPVEEIV